MNDQKEIDKLSKLVEKRKSGTIIKMMGKADAAVLVQALDALGKIGDEDSCNMITHYMEHEDNDVRTAACKAAMVIGTEYMRTRVRRQMSVEKDEGVKKALQDALNVDKGM